MIPDDLEALALADSIGALDPDERAELQARLANLSPEQRAKVARLYETAIEVAAAAEDLEPPPHVRERVLAAARAPSRYTLSSSDADWTDTPFPGIRARILSVDKPRALATMLIRAEPGAVYPSHKHHGPEECYVVSGSIVIDGRTLNVGDFHHADEDSEHGEITTVDGAVVLLVGAIEDYLPHY